MPQAVPNDYSRLVAGMAGDGGKVNIYVVQGYDDRTEFGGYDEPWIEGVFSTREAAETHAILTRRTDKYGYRRYARVDAVVLDLPGVEAQ